MSEDSSGEAEMEAEPETSDPEDVRDLHPGVLLYKASKARNLPVMAEALAHGADVNLVNEEEEGKTPLIQAVTGVSPSPGATVTPAQEETDLSKLYLKMKCILQHGPR